MNIGIPFEASQASVEREKPLREGVRNGRDHRGNVSIWPGWRFRWGAYINTTAGPRLGNISSCIVFCRAFMKKECPIFSVGIVIA